MSFMYFGFGSNLLKERLQLKNPSARFHCTGKLKDYNGRVTRNPYKNASGFMKDYILNFGLWDEHVDSRWHGGSATIQPCPGGEVWGVVWTMNNDNLTSLDTQEGVDKGYYSPLEVTVETDSGPVSCRTYQMNHFHACPPSPQYKQVVCLGAEQNGLPAQYVEKLEAVITNNYSGPSVLDEITTAKK